MKAKRNKKRDSPRAAGAAALRRKLRNTERRLRQIEQRYEFAMGAINESVYDWDIAGGRIVYSESMQRAIGLPPEMLKTTGDWWARIHPDDLPRYRAMFIAHFKGTTARFECEYRYRAADGAWRWCRQHGIALRNSRGRAVRMVGSTGDITQLKEREEELVAQKALTQAIVEQIPGAVFVKDPEGRFTLANRGWSAMSGIPAERAVGRTVHDLYPAELAKRFAAEDEKLLAQGTAAAPNEAVHEGPRPGQFRIVRKAVLSGGDGSVQGLVCTSTDVSELKRAESELASQAKFTNDVFDSLPLALSMRDGDGKYLFVNRTWEKNFGATREAVVGATLHRRLAKEEADRVLALDRAALARGPGAPLDLSEFSLRGRHYLQTRTVMVDSLGAVRGVLIASLDVTEKHQIEQTLARERERLGDQMALTHSLIDENPSAMYLKDRQGRYVTVNDAWLAMVGVSRERAIGHNVLELFPEAESERYHAEDMRLLAQGEGSSEVESLRTGPDGKPQWVIIRKAVLRRADGEVVGLIGANTDITRLKNYEAQLADRAKFITDLVDALPVSIALRDTECRFLQVNRAWERYFNLRREVVLGKRFIELPGWKENAELAQVAKDAEQIDRDVIARGPGVEPLEMEVQRLGRTYLNSRQVFTDTAGRTVGVLATGLDTTERHAMEEALRHAEREAADRAKFVSEMVDALPISVAMRDLDGRYVLVNQTWERYFGIRREDVLGRRRRELRGPEGDPLRAEDAARIEAADRELLARPDYVPEPRELLRLGRSYLISSRALADSAGKPTGILSAGVETTERHAMMQALAAERHRLALVVSATQAGIIDWDTGTEEPWYSERFKEMLGYPADADTSAWASIFGALMHPEDRDRSREVFLTGLVSRGAPNSVAVQEPLELRLRRADGGWLWVQSMGLTLHDEAGEAKRYLAAITDISRRREQDEALGNQVKFINDLFDSVPLLLAMRDPDGRFLFVNKMWETYLGRKRSEVVGALLHECLPKDEADAVLAGDRTALAHGAGAPVELTELAFRGRHLMQTRTVMSDAHGQVLGVLVASLDATERRAMEQALAIEQRRFEIVVRAARVGIVDWEGETHRTFYSPRFREILGHAPDADTSQWPDYFKVLIHPDDRDRVAGRWQAFIRGKGPEGPRGEYYSPEEYRLLRADGNYVWVQVSGIAVRDELARVTRWIAAITDITERRAQEEELRQSVRLREEVERMSRHDLKTPLNSVIAMSRLLREGGRVAAEDAELLGTIERAGYRILNMVNLSLDLFRMETGTYQFHPQAVDLAEVACRVAADLESQAASKSLDVRVRANGVSAATQEVLARGDELLCYSMFANLVKNAIEASPPGGTVSISLERGDESVVAEVHNPGAVPEAMRGRFFRKYATTGKSAGLGLGTYSAQLMARVQEGELSLDTSEATGTTLVARLKAAGADLPRAVESRAAASASIAAGEALPPRKVLVVDDDEFNRLVLRRYLPSPPLGVTFAVNGRAALEAAAREWPDVVLLDLEMPVMDGYEAAHKLREMERAGGLKPCQIVAISSNDEDSVVQRALAAGCDHYVVKPAPRQLLWQLLGATASAGAAEAAPAAAGASDAVVVEEDLRAVLPEFLRSRRELLDQMPAALAGDDRALFRRQAHRLAGSFALYGFAWASAQCRAIEGDALTGQPQELEARAATVRAYLDGVKIEFAPAKSAASAQKL